MIKRQHENIECMCEEISRKKLDFSVLGVVVLCIHTISHADKLLKVCSKFQAFISCNYLFTEIMKEGVVDPLNGWHFNAPGYLNSWQ